MGWLFAQLDRSLRKKLFNSWTTQNPGLLAEEFNFLFCISVYIDLLLLARLTFLGSLPISLYMDRPSYLPKDHGNDRWMLTVMKLASTSLCSWDVCSEFTMSYWIMVILDNWSLFFKYRIASNIVTLPASYIKTFDAYIDCSFDTLKLFNTFA